MKNTGKRYEQQFKDEIIRLVKVEKRTVASIERDFGVKEQTVRNWLKDHKDASDPEKVRIAELEAKLKEANKKLADQEMTIEILKKATAIFAKNDRK